MVRTNITERNSLMKELNKKLVNGHAVNGLGKCKHGIRMGGDCKGCSELIEEIRDKNMKMVNDLEEHQKRDASKSDLKFGMEVIVNDNMADNEVAVLGSLSDNEREVIKKKLEN